MPRESASTLEVPREVWDLILETNLPSIFQLCQFAGRIMLEKGYGKIINRASMSTFIGIVETTAYTGREGSEGER